MEVECCYNVDPSAFFPYKRVIKGGKLFIFPIRDSKGNICGFHPSEVLQSGDSRNEITGSSSTTEHTNQVSQALPDLSRPDCSCSPAYPTQGDVHHIPLTSKVKKALAPTEEDTCRHLITPLQRLTAGKQEILQQQLRARIQDMEKETEKVVYPTPMSFFRNDDRILRKAFRWYKRDLQLEKERGSFMEKPKHFYDENTKTWYNDMVRSEHPCLNREIQELMNRTDCVTFADATGGSCFHCPERKIP
ncbi:hypothetical protein ElyMa_005569800 [Elysia marginata]|uniref:Uncharacterized protein n=1 Tax=Elysia marginata TaxID=1093978 RepID=A0AAV4F2A3_9GAST|nr:hypothetical protein ElyMa_005569800 [Elysia marginata]